MHKKQEDKKVKMEMELVDLKSLQSLKEAGEEDEYANKLKERDIKNHEECE